MSILNVHTHVEKKNNNNNNSISQQCQSQRLNPHSSALVLHEHLKYQQCVENEKKKKEKKEKNEDRILL